jgi:enediyne biosynthesis protein E4
MQRRGGQWSAFLLSAIVIGGVGCCGWRWWDVRRYRNVMAGIDDAMRHGRYATATRDLSALLDRSPGSDRAAYLLGICEKARGRSREADAAWAAVPPDSPFIGRAVSGRFDLLVEQGRFAEAEQLILRAADDLGSEGSSALRMILIPIFVQEGRAEEAQRLIESRWRSLNAKGEGTPEQAVNLARLHMELRWNVQPAEPLRAYLDQVGRLAAEDDRIWLGRANLAIRAGSFDEARQWIDDCLRRHPDDRVVWRARLDWSMRTHRSADARNALKHLSAGPATREEFHRVSAWLAGACGDIEGERRELTALIIEAPEDLDAMDRLANLEKQAGAATVVDGLSRRKAEIEHAQARYRELYRRNQPSRDAEEMARLAERLGHRFEAIVFLNAALADEPDRADLREALHRLEEAAREQNDTSRNLFERMRIDCVADEPKSRVEAGSASRAR